MNSIFSNPLYPCPSENEKKGTPCSANGLSVNTFNQEKEVSQSFEYPPDLPYIDPKKDFPWKLGHDLRKKVLCNDSTFSIVLYLDDIAAKFDLKDCECLYIASNALLRSLHCQDLFLSPQESLKTRVRLLEHYMCGTVESEFVILNQMEAFCRETLQKSFVLGILVQTLYGLSILTEQGILEWAKHNTSLLSSCCSSFSHWLNQLSITMTNESQVLCNDADQLHNQMNNFFVSPVVDTPSSGETIYSNDSSVMASNISITSSQCSTIFKKLEGDDDEITLDSFDEDDEDDDIAPAPKSVQFSNLVFMRDTVIEDDQVLVYHEETFDYIEIMPLS